MTNACTWKPSTVTLADGREVLSDSEDWRAESEARFILDMATKPARLAFLDGIEKRRGLEARMVLEQRIMDLWRVGKLAEADSNQEDKTCT